MNEVATTTTQLPDTIEDLSKFVIVGREKLKAVKAAISAIEKVNLAKEVHQQKLTEAQELAEVVIEAEARLGELLKAIPKATKGTGANQYSKETAKFPTSGKNSKSSVTTSMGLDKHQVSDFQQMADKPEIIERAKAKAKEENRVLSHSDVMKEIKFESQLDYLEEHADQKTMERVRSGEQSITSAWVDTKRQEQKKERTKQESSLEAAMDRHEDFTQKKQEGIVSLEAIKQDKEDQAKIANALFWEINKALSNLGLIGAMAEAGDKDLKPLRYISDEKTALLKNSIGNARKAIIRIQEVII